MDLTTVLKSPLFYFNRTNSRLHWTGHGRESGVSHSHLLHGSAKTWSPSLPPPVSYTLWSGRRRAPPSLWWGRTSSTCRQRSEWKEGG